MTTNKFIYDSPVNNLSMDEYDNIHGMGAYMAAREKELSTIKNRIEIAGQIDGCTFDYQGNQTPAKIMSQFDYEYMAAVAYYLEMPQSKFQKLFKVRVNVYPRESEEEQIVFEYRYHGKEFDFTLVYYMERDYEEVDTDA